MESPNQIKSLRIKVGLSQSKVAMYLGISQSEYGRIELGRRKIGKYLEKLAEILAVNSEQLAAFDAPSNDQKIKFPEMPQKCFYATPECWGTTKTCFSLLPPTVCAVGRIRVDPSRFLQLHAGRM